MSVRARFVAWADVHLVPQWRCFWKMWSVRLAGLFGLLGAFFADPNNAAMWTGALYGLPPEVRKILPGAVFLLLAAVPTAVRLLRQKKLPDA